jgi:Ankyrin repeats (3 copies)
MFSTKTIFLGALVAAMAASTCLAANSADLGACHYTPDARESWKSLLNRQLHVLDPSNAERLSKVSANIVDGNVDALKHEIEAGLNPNTQLKVGGGEILLLELAVAACQDRVARELVRMGASANGNDTSTPLVVGAAKGQADLVEFLLQHGASVDKVDMNGHTALEDAVRQHQKDPVPVLLKHGANPNRPIGGNATVLDLVLKSKDPADQAIAQHLQAHGAISGLSKPSPMTESANP